MGHRRLDQQLASAGCQGDVWPNGPQADLFADGAIGESGRACDPLGGAPELGDCLREKHPPRAEQHLPGEQMQRRLPGARAFPGGVISEVGHPNLTPAGDQRTTAGRASAPAGEAAPDLRDMGEPAIGHQSVGQGAVVAAAQVGGFHGE